VPSTSAVPLAPPCFCRSPEAPDCDCRIRAGWDAASSDGRRELGTQVGHVGDTDFLASTGAAVKFAGELAFPWQKADRPVGPPRPLISTAMLRVSSPALPEYCRNQSSPVVLSLALASTGASN
jgi:hypothetical protein